MKLEEQNLNEPLNPQLNIGAVRRSLFFVRWDLQILIRNENEKQKFKP